MTLVMFMQRLRASIDEYGLPDYDSLDWFDVFISELYDYYCHGAGYVDYDYQDALPIFDFLIDNHVVIFDRPYEDIYPLEYAIHTFDHLKNIQGMK